MIFDLFKVGTVNQLYGYDGYDGYKMVITGYDGYTMAVTSYEKSFLKVRLQSWEFTLLTHCIV